MAFRFFRRVRLAPGLTLNLSKRGGSLSFGPRGAKITAGTSGVRRTVSLPGTGLWYTEKVDGSKWRSSRGGRGSGGPSSNGALPPAPTVQPQDRLTLGFFKRLVTPKGEEHFVDGMRQVVLGDDAKALDHLRQAVHLADAAFMVERGAGVHARTQLPGHTPPAALPGVDVPLRGCHVRVHVPR